MKWGKGKNLLRLDEAKKQGDRIKRGKWLKLAPAIIAVLLIAGILSSLLVASVRSLYQTSSTISSVGTFKAIGIGVYWDKDSTRQVTALEWGYLAPGSKKSFTIYISNEGALPLTLSISLSNWSPPQASNYMTLTWNYNSQILNAATTIPVTITLTVSSGITGVNNFNFDITAEGTYNK